MTEAEWLTGTDPGPMLDCLGEQASDRKLRLFGCACIRSVGHLLADGPISEKTIEFAERFADGQATRNELHGQAWGTPGEAYAVVLWKASDAAETAAEFAAGRVRMAVSDFTPRDAAFFARQPFFENAKAVPEAAYDDERSCQADLLRDIFGNRFRPAAVQPRWRTADVLGLARGIYDDRAFDRLPLLADALMDAGCDNEQVLSHCRSDGPHVCGCWVVDLVLGKE